MTQSQSFYYNWNLVIGYYLVIGLPARSRFGEGRCLEFGYYP
jgi:hypothetical protein